MFALLTHAAKHLAVIGFGLAVASSTCSETVRDENIFVLDIDDSGKLGRNPQQLIWERFLGNYLLTNNISGARIGVNIVGLASVASLGVGFIVPLDMSVLDGFNPESYDCSPANPDRLVVAFASLFKESKSSGSSVDKSSYLEMITKYMTELTDLKESLESLLKIKISQYMATEQIAENGFMLMIMLKV